jgi:hypothetical protein
MLIHSSCDNVANISDVSFSHCGIDRQGHRPLKHRTRLRKILRTVTETVSIIRMQMQWNEMHTRPNVLPLKEFDKGVAVDFALSYDTHSLDFWLRPAYGNLTIEATDGTPFVSRMNSI